MKKKWVIGLAIVILAIAALRFVDLSSFKGKIEVEASRASGLDVTINGDVRLGMAGARPALVAYDVRAMGQKGRTDITASRISVAIPLSPRPKKFLIEVDDFVMNDRLFGSYMLPLRLLEDGIEITDVTGTLEKASVTGNFSHHGGKMAGDIQVKNLDYSVFAKGITGGDADMVLDITSAGRDGATLIRNLNGTALLSGGAGHMEGDAVNLWAGNMLSTIMQGRKAETDIECIVTDFKIENGVAASKAIIVDTDKVAIFGKGRVNLAAENLQMTFTPKPKDKAFIDLAIPVTVMGGFEQPRVIPDPAGILKKIGGFVLGAVNPATLGILPMFEDDRNIDAPCAAYLNARGDSK